MSKGKRYSLPDNDLFSSDLLEVLFQHTGAIMAHHQKMAPEETTYLYQGNINL